MLAVQTPFALAQRTKEFLMKNNLFNKEFPVFKEKNFLYLPLIRLNQSQVKDLEKRLKLKILNKRQVKIEKPLSLQALLKNKLTQKELALLPHSQEVVGTILILEIPPKLQKKEKLIARAFLRSNKSLKTIVKKSQAHEGSFRLRKVKFLAGEKTKETTHKENNIKLKINLEKTYFSARLANERLRIAKQIKAPEEVLVMFSGAAPYPLVLAKNSPARHITGIEINPFAHQLALENIKLNKLENRITLLEGDVRLLLPKIPQTFDRILMPLPKTGELFLPLALQKARSGTIIHFYAFLEETKISQEAEKIKDICRQHKHEVKILRKVFCGQFAPYVFRVCFDLKVLR